MKKYELIFKCCRIDNIQKEQIKQKDNIIELKKK